MNTKFLIRSLIVFLLVGSFSCMKKDLTNQVRYTQPEPDPGGPPSGGQDFLKEVATFPVGFGIDRNSFNSNTAYRDLVIANADMVTFGYEMKHGAIVKNSGILDFTNADQLYDAVSAAGLSVFGHTLAWHQNQNATYLNQVVNGEISGSSGAVSDGPVVVFSDGFEKWGDNGVPVGWTVTNATYGSFAQGSATKDVNSGNYSLQVNINEAGTGIDNWKLQILGPSFSTVEDHEYQITFWIRASGSGALWQLESRTGGSTNYTGDQPTPLTWTKQSVNFTAKASDAAIAFDMGKTPVGVFTYIDDVQIVDLTPDDDDGSTGPGTTEEEVDAALRTWITGMVNHYKGKVAGWDVVNEPMADGQSGLRNSTNTSVAPGATDIFFWSDYLGRAYALKAFNYAHAADPDALLFINDYNLESNAAKLDSLLNFVDELKDQGAHIDGIGTQMHININTSNDDIDQAFMKLAATGLLVRVSELDIRVNPSDNAGFNFTAQIAAEQADKYKYVVSSYIKNVPQAQRAGFIIWGVGDSDSWINVTQMKNDFPLLFDKNYEKKPAFNAVLDALGNP